MKNKGMTLIELIVASTLMLILASLMIKGVLFGWKILEVDKNFAEAAILSNSLIAKLQDELNYAEIEQDPDNNKQIIYSGGSYGFNAKLLNSGGQIIVETASNKAYDLIPPGAYGHLSGKYELIDKTSITTSSGTMTKLDLNLEVSSYGKVLRDIDFSIYPVNN